MGFDFDLLVKAYVKPPNLLAAILPTVNISSHWPRHQRFKRLGLLIRQWP
jgi:hypothetical protein